MLKYLFTFLILLLFHHAFGQRDKSLPWVGHNIDGDSCHVNVKLKITKLTKYVFDKHPLLWAREQVTNNLLKTDTTFDDNLHRKTVYYYSKQGQLIQIVTSSTKPENKSVGTKIYDEFNNLIFWENLEQNRNTVMRIRRGYGELNRMLFECIYWETPFASLRIYPDEGKVARYDKPVCDCDF